MHLPKFKYHPDPVKTGSVVASDKACQVCGQSRGFCYAGIPYATKDLEVVCPWCIADGSAHEKRGAEFTDRDSIGGGGWEAVPTEVAEEVAFRTPGFSGWQQERWFTHCGDAAAFLGPKGRAELAELGTQAVEAIRKESGYKDGEWTQFYNSLDGKYGPATAYLFRCLHCGKIGGYSDCN
jgi:uncharacterized protein CbrC (UPF0167 family)